MTPKYKVLKNNLHHQKARPHCKQYKVIELLEPVASIFSIYTEHFYADTRKECNAWIKQQDSA